MIKLMKYILVIGLSICLISMVIPAVLATMVAAPVNIGITPISDSSLIQSWEGPNLEGLNYLQMYPNLQACPDSAYGPVCNPVFVYLEYWPFTQPWYYEINYGDGTYVDCPMFTSNPVCPTSLYNGVEPDPHVYTSAGTYLPTIYYQGTLGGPVIIENSQPITIGPYVPQPTPTPPTPTPISTPNYPPPKASFTTSVQSGESPLSIDFTDTSSGQIVSWNWDYGDGVDDMHCGPNALHTYDSKPGQSLTTYTVTLTVTDSAGRTSQSTNEINVYEVLKPAFTVNTSSGSIPLTVQFTDNTPDIPSDIQSYTWIFGDGTTESFTYNTIQKTVTHTYSGNGPYPAKLTIVSNGGGEIFTSNTIFITGPAQININPNFIATPQSGNSPLTVQFTDTSTITPQTGIQDSIESWHWDFGDHQTSTDQNPVHTYSNTGSYTVQLTVGDALHFSSKTQTKNQFIVVTEPAMHVVTEENTTATMDHPYSVTVNIENPSNDTIFLNLVPTETSLTNYPDEGQESVGTAFMPESIPPGQTDAYQFTYQHHWYWLSWFTSGYAEWINQFGPYAAYMGVVLEKTDATGPEPGLVSALLQNINNALTYINADLHHTYTYSFAPSQSVDNLQSYPVTVGPSPEKYSDFQSSLLDGESAEITMVLAPETDGLAPGVVIIGSAEYKGADTDMNAAIDPDMNYKQVVTKQPIVIPEINEISDSVSKQTALSSIRLLEDKIAYSKTISKYDGAEFANDQEWMLIQKNMASIYAEDEAADNENLSASMSLLINEMRNDNNIAVSDTTVQQTISQLNQQGFSSQENRILKELGCPDTEIQMLANLTANTVDPGQVVNYSTSIPDVLNAQQNIYSNESASSVSYVLNSSIYANIRFDPGIVDLAANSQWVRAYVEIPNQNVSEINISTVKMNGIPAVNDTSYSFVSNPTIITDPSTGFQEIELSFPKQDVTQELLQGQNEVTVTGTLNGIFFAGTGQIIVYTTSQPNASFSANTTSGDSPLTVAFSDTSTGYPDSWVWDFGDGTYSYEQNPIHTYTSGGSKNVTLTVDNENGLSITQQIDYITVTSSLVPTAGFTASTTSTNPPYIVSFADQSSNSPTDWFWQFGDGSNSTDQDPEYTYAEGGNYTVALTVENEYGSNTIFQTLSLPGSSNISTPSVNLPVAYFIPTSNSARAPYTITFTDLSTNSPTSWYWDFGDGSNSTAQNPVHIYSINGNYTVALVASNNYGSNLSIQPLQLPGSLSPGSSPVANFTANLTTGTAPLTVQFNDTSMNSPTMWNWSFGDGNFSSLQNITYTFSSPGSYLVTLTAGNCVGNSSANQTIIVSPLIVTPVVKFISTPTSGIAPLTVQFNDTSVNSPTMWNWSFGDGTFSSQQNVTHTFNSVANYTITLTAGNSAGNNSTTQYVNVMSAVIAPIASFVSNVTSGASPLTVQFNDTSVNSPTMWNWSFGDGTFSSQQNVTHTFNSSGNYTVSLTVANSDGSNTDSINNYIQVNAAPTTHGVSVVLLNSLGQGISGANVNYYANGWKVFGITNSTGAASMPLSPGTYTFQMNYAGGVEDLLQTVTSTSVVTFQTTNATVKLLDSKDNRISGSGVGSVQYYANGWKTFGSTNDGTCSLELLPASYTFQMNYAGGTQNLLQNISVNPSVTFQTTNVTAELIDGNGNLITPANVGSVQYYANGWKTFGSTNGGVCSLELLPVSYTFQMVYVGTSNSILQNVSQNSLVIFRASNATVKFLNSTGGPISSGIVSYYANGWKTFGTTDATGTTSYTLLPGAYTFQLSYAGAVLNEYQNTTNGPILFQTTNTSVLLKDHQGNPLDTGSVQYYANGWKTFGSTQHGIAMMELLPDPYTFSMTYAGGTNTLNQNISVNSIVNFQTGQVVSTSGNCTQYYANGWRTFTNGIELLPNNYPFKYANGTSIQYSILSGLTNTIQ